jgi:hypothetical protein
MGKYNFQNQNNNLRLFSSKEVVNDKNSKIK